MGLWTLLIIGMIVAANLPTLKEIFMHFWELDVQPWVEKWLDNHIPNENVQIFLGVMLMIATFFLLILMFGMWISTQSSTGYKGH
jgi:hypothetical protein